jgi:sigma-54 specific flagellar transcriptional regulator A
MKGRFMSEVTQEEECLIELVGQSPAINKLSQLIRQVAKTSATVLILGESGTGKELIARLIHGFSARHKSPFVPVNCAAIPLELLESELFGHEKGAFTGAYTARQGRFELADSGTLFLDEIGDMPHSMQAKLLRVLQERTYERIGSNKALKSNVRVIAATHKNLTDSMKAGEFREDLFYRLNVFPIYIPPLRERKEDIPLLLNHFIQQYSNEGEKRPRIQIDQDTLRYLETYDWPGNVRELANLVERLMIMYPDKRVTMAELPDHFLKSNAAAKESILSKAFNALTEFSLPNDDSFDLKEHLAQLELALIAKALNEYKGVVAKAAKRLGLRRTTLVEKMKKYGIERESILRI